MRSRYFLGAVATVLALVAAHPVRAADSYGVDPAHSSVTFKIQHVGISYVQGRFNQVSGQFTIDKDDPSKSSYSLTINVESVDTNQKQRDTHLRSDTFFNAKQFPTITFKSTSVKPVKDGYEVTGDLTLHGETKPITFKLSGGKETEFPPKMKRIGYWTDDLKIKRSDFGMDQMLNAIGDEVSISVSVEAVKK
jgi:polyisoprenoid-binding protein YceI